MQVPFMDAPAARELEAKAKTVREGKLDHGATNVKNGQEGNRRILPDHRRSQVRMLQAVMKKVRMSQDLEHLNDIAEDHEVVAMVVVRNIAAVHILVRIYLMHLRTGDMRRDHVQEAENGVDRGAEVSLFVIPVPNALGLNTLDNSSVDNHFIFIVSMLIVPVELIPDHNIGMQCRYTFFSE